MKKILLFAIILSTVLSCKKDDDNINGGDQIEITEDGLYVGAPPIVNDTIMRNENMNIEIVNANEDDIDISNIYELNLEGGSFSGVKKGTTIIDNKDGRLWVVTEILENSGGQIRVNAFPGLLGNLFQNAIVQASFNENRAKENSDYPYKLPSNQVTLKAYNQDFLWQINQNNVSSNTIEISDGASLSTDEDGNVIIEFSNFNILNLNGSSLQITEGTATLKGAVDTEMRFNPIETILGGSNPLTMQVGSIKDFKSAVYLSADFDVTFGGELDLIEFNETLPLTNHIIVVPVGCCAFIELELDVFIRATASLSTEFTLTPNFKNKNDFVGISSYEGLGSVPTFEFEFENLENTATVNDTYNVDAGIKLEFVPKASVYLYGLVGPTAELIPYFDLNAGAQLDGSTNTITWDAQINYGIDSKLVLDINVLGNNSWIENSEIGIQPIATLLENNIFEENLYRIPDNSDITQGNNQTAIINTQLPNPIKIKINDKFGNGVEGITVFFETQNNSGFFDHDFFVTDDDGQVINNWTLGSTVGTQIASIYTKDGNGNIIPTTVIELTATGTTTGITLPPHSPNPLDNATNVSLNGSLSFTEGDNTPTDATFMLYFDTNSNPSTAYNLPQGTTTLSYSNLIENTEYYWIVETLDNNGNILATSPIWTFTTTTSSSGGVFNGDVFLFDQQEVDNFGANNYSIITGDLGIAAPSGVDLDLNSLSSLTEIQGELYFGCESCSSLQGLNNITSVGYLTLRRFQSLPNFEGLNGLTNVDLNVVIGGVFFNKNLNLYNFDGLENLATVGGYIYARGNDQLQNIDAFSGLESVAGDYLRIRENINLTNLCGLTNIVVSGGIAGYYSVYENAYNPTEQDIINGDCAQ